MRYLGLDVGSKKIGVAVGESLASELTTLASPKNHSFYEENGRIWAIEQIKKLMELEEADAIVVGLPVNEDGQPTEESVKISNFSRELKEKLGVNVHFVDETLTSFMAEEIIVSQGESLGNSKERVHQVAAQLILQQYLEDNS
ncbi:MAG: Holliday junction resolvase RuvX [Patescibacteria group bacterium]